MKIAVLTSGIMPVPAVQGGAVESLTDLYLAYNERHRLHDITVYSVYHPLVRGHRALQSAVNHYRYVDTSSPLARLRKRCHGLLHRDTYYHYTIDYFLVQALRDLRRRDYDVVVVENRPGYALRLQGVVTGPLVYHLHNDFLNSGTPDGEQLYDAASRIVTVSDYIRGRVQTCCPQDTKTVAVLNGIDLSPYAAPPAVSRSSVGFADSDFVLAFSGRLIREKGITELVAAMNLLSDHPSVKLMVMGSSFYGNTDREDGFVRHLKSAAKGLEGRIRFTGYVSHALMPSYLRMADVAVVPSTWEEPFGLTVLEGMAAGLPIVTTDRGGIPEIVTADNAVVVPCGEGFVRGLADAILALYRDGSRRQRMGAASRALSAGYGSEAFARRFFDALSGVSLR